MLPLQPSHTLCAVFPSLLAKHRVLRLQRADVVAAVCQQRVAHEDGASSEKRPQGLG